MKRGYRYRLYPTAEQAVLMARSCGVARLVYNSSLEQRSLAYRTCGQSVGWARQDAEWVQLKLDPEFAWLREVHSDVIGQSLRDLEGAFRRFFAGQAAYPKPHRKGERDSFRLCQRHVKDRKTGRVHVSVEVRKLNRKWAEVKLPKLGWVKFRCSRRIVGEIRHATVMRTPLGWEVSFCAEDGVLATTKRRVGPTVGIDAGVAVSFATSAGAMLRVPEPGPGEKERRRRLERHLARQHKGSRRRERTKRQLARVRAREARRRQDCLHKLTTSLVREHALIAIEDLKVRNMTRSARGTVQEPAANVAQKTGLNRAILAQGWGEFRRQLSYKTEEHGVTLIAVRPMYTSQRCFACGHTAPGNRESQAVFQCVACGHSEHADIAARNILAASINQLDPADGLAAAARRALSEDGSKARTPNSRAA